MTQQQQAALPVVGRFAPSPSGRMHMGNVYAALLADRCPREHALQIIDDLRWLGLAWDNDEIPWQSERGALYQQYFDLLREQELVYPCFCSRAELRAAEAPHASDGRVIYAGTCRYLSEATRADRYLRRAPAWRVKVPAAGTVFTDGHYGALPFNLARDWGDFIVRRSDGVWAYQLAVVVDDGLTGVTEVVRGVDLLTSSPVQLYLFEKLGLPAPSYFHVPLLLSPTGARLAKRDKAVDMGYFRAQLPGPEPLIGYLGYLTGQLDAPEPLTVGELLTVFDRSKIPASDIVVPPGWLTQVMG